LALLRTDHPGYWEVTLDRYEAAALLAKLEAAESVAVALWMAAMELKRLHSVSEADKAFAATAAYRNPAPAAEGEKS
jgi:hypothetical protein